MDGNILHVDFYEIEMGKILRARVSVHINGSPIGVRNGRSQDRLGAGLLRPRRGLAMTVERAGGSGPILGVARNSAMHWVEISVSMSIFPSMPKAMPSELRWRFWLPCDWIASGWKF
jgi:hypothetical protein